MKSINGKTVLVTGGAGFIGSVFCGRLLKLGCDVIAYDNLSSGKYELIKPFINSKSFTFAKGDLLDLNRLSATLKKHKPDAIIHLAANPDIMKSFANTRLDLEQGTIATYNVVEASRKAGLKDILFSSSSVVYGDSVVKPTPEDYGPLTPISLYGASKLASEGLITSFSHLYGLNYHIYRFANVVGENMTHGVIHSFLSKLNEDRKVLHVLSDGTPKKGYLDVNDCISGMLLVYGKSKEREKIYNIALMDQTSVRQIAEMIVERFSPKAKIKYGPHHYGWPGDIVNTSLSCKKIMKLGFKPKYGTSNAAVSHAIDANSYLFKK